MRRWLVYPDVDRLLYNGIAEVKTEDVISIQGSDRAQTEFECADYPVLSLQDVYFWVGDEDQQQVLIEDAVFVMDDESEAQKLAAEILSKGVPDAVEHLQDMEKSFKSFQAGETERISQMRELAEVFSSGELVGKPTVKLK